jgi:transposase
MEMDCLGSVVVDHRGYAPSPPSLCSLRELSRTRHRLTRQLAIQMRRMDHLLEDVGADLSRPGPRLLVKVHLRQIDALRDALLELNGCLDEAVAPFRTPMELLTAIPGVDAKAAQIFLSEIGANLSKFPSVGHLLFWAGVAPGKRRRRLASPWVGRHAWLRAALLQSVRGATREADTYLRAQFLRVKARRGARRAVLAVASSLLGLVYSVLREALPAGA